MDVERAFYAVLREMDAALFAAYDFDDMLYPHPLADYSELYLAAKGGVV